MTITVVDKGRKLIEQRIALLGELQLVVGVQDGEARQIRKEGNVTKGFVAKLIQFGAPNMSPRPYMDIAIANIKQDLSLQIQRATSIAASKKKSAVSLALRKLGEQAASKVVDAIDTFPSSGGAVPFDTGQTRAAVTYTVRDGDRIVERGKPK